MRRIVGLLMVIIGSAGIAARWVPAAFMPIPVEWWWMPAGCTIGILGLWQIVARKPRHAGFNDGPLLSTLRERDFTITPSADGWLAKGNWKSISLVVRKTTGYEAARFARPWTIVVALPGTPIDPWPLLPEEGLIVERHANGFSVSCTDLSRVERMHRLGERLNQLIEYRQS